MGLKPHANPVEPIGPGYSGGMEEYPSMDAVPKADPAIYPKLRGHALEIRLDGIA